MPLPPEGAHLEQHAPVRPVHLLGRLWWPGGDDRHGTARPRLVRHLLPRGSLTGGSASTGADAPCHTWSGNGPAGPSSLSSAPRSMANWSASEYPQAALLVLSGSTVAAARPPRGREKRIWCRYLCPASGCFRRAGEDRPLHYKVDRDAWDRPDAPVERLNCAPLVRTYARMTSASECRLRPLRRPARCRRAVAALTVCRVLDPTHRHAAGGADALPVYSVSPAPPSSGRSARGSCTSRWPANGWSNTTTSHCSTMMCPGGC